MSPESRKEIRQILPRHSYGNHKLIPYIPHVLGAVLFAIGFSAGLSAWTQKIRDDQRTEWIARTSQALADPDHLPPGQRFYERVGVVGAGVNWDQKSRMDQDRGWINVRGYGSMSAEVVGQIRVGEEIKSVVLIDNWVAFECDKASGLEIAGNTNPRLCALHADYALANK